jgi:branched-chain amino acid transport system substrate-binding protein
MDTISIGLLLPSSTIFPIGKNFEKGLKVGLKSLTAENIQVELMREFIGGGDIKFIENACKKFFDFDEVDLVTGIISNRAVVSVAERFKAKNMPLLVNNPGGHIPVTGQLNEFIFLNSMHLWRHAWTLGNWGVKKFGKKGMFIGAVYDAGYSFSQMFYDGMYAADLQADWSFSVPPMPPNGGLSDMSVIFPFLEQYQPDFIMAAFCGAETTLFLNEFIARGWHLKTSVLGLPYLLAPFEPLNNDITIYTTLPFEDFPDISPADVFYRLGLQTGNNIADAVKTTIDRADLQNEFAKQNRMFNTALTTQHLAPPVTIIENTIKAGAAMFTSESLTRSLSISLDPEYLDQLTQGILSGWFNPYLCI